MTPIEGSRFDIKLLDWNIFRIEEEIRTVLSLGLECREVAPTVATLTKKKIKLQRKLGGLMIQRNIMINKYQEENDHNSSKKIQ